MCKFGEWFTNTDNQGKYDPILGDIMHLEGGVKRFMFGDAVVNKGHCVQKCIHYAVHSHLYFL